MKITICGSIAFYKEMEEVKEQLEKLGHEVKLPPSQFEANFLSLAHSQKDLNKIIAAAERALR